MKNTAKLVVIVIYICSTQQILAMEKIKFLKKEYKYKAIGSELDGEVNRIAYLLKKKNLDQKKQIELANLCLKYPQKCVNIDLFSKVSPNLFFISGKSFLGSLLQEQKSEKHYSPLINEALQHKDLEPHNASTADDIVFKVFNYGDKDQKNTLIHHKNFNPNIRYGKLQQPLATLLFIHKHYDSLLKLTKHKDFAPMVMDLKEQRPGYVMLENCELPIHEECFLSFMGPNLAGWNMRFLGLEKSKNLDSLLRVILKSKKDRLLILKKFIEQFALRHEDLNWNSNYINSFHELFINENAHGSTEYINKEFACAALKMMVDYKAVTSRIKNGVRACAYWFNDTDVDLGNINLSSIHNAGPLHRIADNSESCSICLEEAGAENLFFKSTLWCDHRFCKSCLLNYIMEASPDEEMICPSRSCDFPVPPALFVAMLDDNPHSRETLKLLMKPYADRCKLQRKKCEETFALVPGMTFCPSCKKEIVLNLKKSHTRVIRCPHCVKEVIIPADNQSALALLSGFTNLGQCNECKTPIDKVDGCENIDCPYCHHGTKWVPLEGQ